MEGPDDDDLLDELELLLLGDELGDIICSS
jgi:hypothetical protein